MGAPEDTETTPPPRPLPLADTVRELVTLRDQPPIKRIVPILPRGTTVSRYVILHAVGAGAMGVVYAAYDYGLDRKVALKLVRDPKRGLIARERLMREAKALAKLSHPNVVSVYDVGDHKDEVFVAMEYIDGRTLRDWLEEKPRGWREVLDVFLRAGDGLAAAHAAGIVHRDFKPDNVLLDAKGRVLVGDFGLAQVGREAEPPPRERPLGASSVLTPTGATIGTPAYMAPEQYGRESLDARADQFSFCVALFESLYGARPFAGETIEDLLVSIEQGRIADTPRAREVPAWLRRAVVRGLALSPEGRHPSMDVLLHLLRRDPRRTRRRWILTASIAAVVLGGAALTLALLPANGGCDDPRPQLAGVWDARQRQAVAKAFRASGSPIADSTWKQVEPALDRYAHAWVAMSAEACEATRVRGEQTEGLLDLRRECLARRRSDLKALTDVLASADADAVSRAADAVGRLPPLEQCADAASLRNEEPTPDAPLRARVDELHERHVRLRAQIDTGRFDASLAPARALVEEARALGYPPMVAATLVTLSQLERRSGNGAKAETLLYEAIAAAEAGRDGHMAVQAWNELIWLVGIERTRYDEARRLSTIARGVIERGGSRPGPLGTLEDTVGMLAFEQGKLAEARPALERGLELRSQSGVSPRNLAASLQHLALLAEAQGRLDDALRLNRSARESLEAQKGPDHPDTLAILGGEAYTLWQLGRVDEAVPLLERGLETAERTGAAESAQAATFHTVMGLVRGSKNDGPGALAAFERALTVSGKVYGLEHPALAHVMHNIAEIHFFDRHYREAIERYEAARAILEKAAPDNPSLSNVLLGLGNTYVVVGEAARGAALLERAAEIREKAGLPPAQIAEVRFKLARALWEAHRERPRARRLAEGALEIFKREGSTALAAEATAWLATRR